VNYHKFFLTSVFSVFCAVCSCASGGTEVASSVLGTSSEALVFLSCKAVSETEINFHFSQPVTVESVQFRPEMKVESVEDGKTVKVRFSEGPGVGQQITADLLAKDKNGNTINVLIPLRTRNARVPQMRINELRTELSKSKAEFIEFKAFGDGNLGALRLFIASNYKSPLVYEFPPVEVKNNEYIVLHLRTTEADSRDELGNNLAESGGTD
jgi:hypothetical protein